MHYPWPLALLSRFLAGLRHCQVSPPRLVSAGSLHRGNISRPSPGAWQWRTLGGMYDPVWSRSGKERGGTGQDTVSATADPIPVFSPTTSIRDYWACGGFVRLVLSMRVALTQTMFDITGLPLSPRSEGESSSPCPEWVWWVRSLAAPTSPTTHCVQYSVHPSY